MSTVSVTLNLAGENWHAETDLALAPANPILLTPLDKLGDTQTFTPDMVFQLACGHVIAHAMLTEIIKEKLKKNAALN
jgi:hypothetical protein